MVMEYEINLRPLTPEQGGGWTAYVPALPGCLGDGETPEEALIDAYSAIQSWIETAQEIGQAIPEPTHEYSGKFTLRLPKSLHAALERKAESDGISLNQECVTMLAYALGKDESLKGGTVSQVMARNKTFTQDMISDVIDSRVKAIAFIRTKSGNTVLYDLIRNKQIRVKRALHNEHSK